MLFPLMQKASNKKKFIIVLGSRVDHKIFFEYFRKTCLTIIIKEILMKVEVTLWHASDLKAAAEI